VAPNTGALHTALWLHIDNVDDVYIFRKAHMLLELLNVRYGTSRFTSETILNDLYYFY